MKVTLPLFDSGFAQCFQMRAFMFCVTNGFWEIDNKYVSEKRKKQGERSAIVWTHFRRAERNVTPRGLNHSSSTNTSPSVSGRINLLSSGPPTNTPEEKKNKEIERTAQQAHNRLYRLCAPALLKKREKTTHQPDEGAIWGMWKVTIATKERDKKIKA